MEKIMQGIVVIEITLGTAWDAFCREGVFLVV